MSVEHARSAEHGPAPRRVISREAREGLMRAWLEILRERHPGVTWVPVDSGPGEASVAPSAGGVGTSEVVARELARPLEGSA